MAKLTAKARNKISGKEFAGPDRSYPIEDASHARNALARSSGKPVHAEIERKVKAKYPGMAVGGKKGMDHSSGMERAMGAHADKIHPVRKWK